MYGYLLYREFLELKHQQPTSKCDVPIGKRHYKTIFELINLNLLVQT